MICLTRAKHDYMYSSYDNDNRHLGMIEYTELCSAKTTNLICPIYSLQLKDEI